MFSPSVDARSRHKSHDEVILHTLELSNSKFHLCNLESPPQLFYHDSCTKDLRLYNIITRILMYSSDFSWVLVCCK
jgi:hypothetical protein